MSESCTSDALPISSLVHEVFMIQTVRIISGFMKFSSWVHEYHWRLLPWVFISWFCRRQFILPNLFRYHRVVFLRFKSPDRSSHFYLGFITNHSNEGPRFSDFSLCFQCHFYCSGFLFWFQCHISDQKEPLVSLVIGLIWQPWENPDPFIYQESLTLGLKLLNKNT